MVRVYLDKITKIFDNKVVAVKNLTLEIPNSAFYALLGPTGCGKTTTMRIISGLEKPTLGRIYFDNEDVTDKTPAARNTALLFQFPVLYTEKTIYDNIAFPLKVRKISKEEIDKRVREVAEMVGLSPYLRDKPLKFNVLIKQKTVLARALVRDPTIFLLDEPFAVLDPMSRIELKAVIQEMLKGRTTLFVTHDQTEALSLAQKIAVMNEGEIIQCGTAEELLYHPRTIFVGHFIGFPGMTFVSCTYKRRNEVDMLDAGEFQYKISRQLGEVIEKSLGYEADLILGIRPELIKLSLKKTESNQIAAVCNFVEKLGNSFILNLEVGKLNIKAKSSEEIKEGSHVWIEFPEKHVRIFDKMGKLIF
jgi:multiple sugar transport system ATP-binding protein